MHGQPRVPIRRRRLQPSRTPGTFRLFRGVTCTLAVDCAAVAYAAARVHVGPSPSPRLRRGAMPRLPFSGDVRGRAHSDRAGFVESRGFRWRPIERDFVRSHQSLASLSPMQHARDSHIVCISEFLSNRFQSIRRSRAAGGCCAVWIELNIYATTTRS